MDLELSKLPPHHLELEQAVLGALMLEKDALLEIIEHVKPDIFYNPNHQRIFEYAILPLFRDNKSIDILTVTKKLQQQNYLNDSLSPYFITTLTNRVASSANILEHALILKQAAIKKNLISTCSEVLKKAYRNDSDSLKILDHAARQMDKIGLQVATKPFKTIGEIVSENIQEIQEVAKSDREITGVASGFYDLDRITAGWQKSDLIILAARPGMGKSTLALNMVEAAAIEFNKKVTVFSSEMSDLQLGLKTISSQSKLTLHRLRVGDLDSDDWKTLHRGIGDLVEANIFIDDQVAISVFEMKTKLRRLKHEHLDLAMVVIDYL